MYWHPQGDYLAIKVDRYTKTRKSTFTSFELFSVKERDIPMEVLELPSKTEKVVDFAWEPKGSRFAVLYGKQICFAQHDTFARPRSSRIHTTSTSVHGL